ncbi:MAG: VOC family protein [Chloroflexota bacterium]|nr:VOC family protein [Chloroflexota bacterium]MDE2969600.1 VOC family protein [Chloroflexota bacterium]
MEVTKHTPGMFSWADLGSPDAAASRKFYAELLQVDAMDLADGPDAIYTTLNKNGRLCFAIYQMPDEMVEMMGGRAFWQSYFTVESADESARRITELGGTLAQEPFDVFEAGRAVVAQDTTGAVFALWEPKNEIGSQVFAEAGALSWNELYTNNPEESTRFYGGLFGWQATTGPMADGTGEYTAFMLDGQPAAGMMEIQKQWGEFPPYWSIYFGVEDLDAARVRAKALGATEITPELTVPEVGRFIYLEDPQGAHLTIIEIAAA